MDFQVVKTAAAVGKCFIRSMGKCDKILALYTQFIATWKLLTVCVAVIWGAFTNKEGRKKRAERRHQHDTHFTTVFHCSTTALHTTSTHKKNGKSEKERMKPLVYMEIERPHACSKALWIISISKRIFFLFFFILIRIEIFGFFYGNRWFCFI